MRKLLQEGLKVRNVGYIANPRNPKNIITARIFLSISILASPPELPPSFFLGLFPAWW
jgi:hypothetical protein